jgi:hypothetical protein
MKLFEETGEVKKAIYGTTTKKVLGGPSEVKKTIICPERKIMAMNNETIDYLVNSDGGKTLDRIRYLIANLYNHHTYPHVELFSMLRNADTEHQELIIDIVGISQSKNGEACFLMINELAPQIINKFNLKEKAE